jgi:hypothetical protein
VAIGRADARRRSGTLIALPRAHAVKISAHPEIYRSARRIAPSYPPARREP